MGIAKFFIRIKCAFLYKIGVHFPHVKVRVWSLRALGYKVGKNVYIAQGVTITVSYVQNRSSLVIGDRCAISKASFIISSHPNHSKLREIFPPRKDGITIGNDSWIGMGVIILPGVTIGEMCVIGSGSVVTKDIPPYSIVAGNPARILRNLKDKELKDIDLV